MARACRAGETVIAAVCGVGCAAALSAMALGIVAEIVARNLFDYSFMSVDEISGYLLVAVMFLGLVVAIHDNALFRVELVTDRLSVRHRYVFDLALSLVFIGFLLVLAYQCFLLAKDSFDGGYTAPTLLATPLYLPQMLIPLGLTASAVLLGLRVLRLFVEPGAASDKKTRP
ncbi:hypothetical protein T31B1_12114 [Salinisphaera sp. T31B1]